MVGMLRRAVSWSIDEDRGIYVITVPPDNTLRIVEVLAQKYRLVAIVAGASVVRMHPPTGDKMSRQIDQPRPGYFKMRIVKGGPFVGAEIRHGPSRDPETGEELERSWLWEALIDGKHARPPACDPMNAGVFRIWESATEISEHEYRFMISDAEWCKQHAPEEPKSKPNAEINLVNLPASHFKPRT